MNTPDDSQVLQLLGIAPTEEVVYEALLREEGASITQLARGCGLGRGTVQELLDSLEIKGLVSHTVGKTPRYLPAPPDVALEVLLLNRQEELERARLEAAKFVQRVRTAVRRSATELVEVLRGRGAIALRFTELQRVASKEVLTLDKPPYVVANTLVNETELAQLRRGIQYRTIYDSEGLSLPRRLEHVQNDVRRGEEARVMQGVPMKLAIADHRIALLPLQLDEGGTEEALIVHRSSLLESLRILFEAFWERALPIPSGDIGTEEQMLDSADQRLLVMLAAGHKEATIANQMGIHRRTVERRLARIMDVLGVRTRLQLGIQIAARGWMAPGASS